MAVAATKVSSAADTELERKKSFDQKAKFPLLFSSLFMPGKEGGEGEKLRFCGCPLLLLLLLISPFPFFLPLLFIPISGKLFVPSSLKKKEVESSRENGQETFTLSFKTGMRPKKFWRERKKFPHLFFPYLAKEAGKVWKKEEPTFPFAV